MLVYIVMDINNWNDRVELEGVFSTREKAEACIADLLDEMSESLRKEKGDCFEIWERELDA